MGALVSTKGRPKVTLAERLAPYKSLGSEVCWIWQNAVDKQGYAKCSATSPFSNKMYSKVSRQILVERLQRDIISSEIAMHTCDTPQCVNPAHIKLGSYSDNNKDTVLKGRRKDKLKISLDKWPAIYALYKQGQTLEAIASLYGVTCQRIGQIVRSFNGR